jgi:MarR family transcriptional regulator, lower aerobic nicotinate degradation pathway regulator
VVGKRGAWRAREQGGFGATTVPKAVRYRTLFVVEHLASLLGERSAAALAELQLSQRQHLILCCVNEFGPCYRTRLAKWTGMDRAEVATQLRTLFDLDLLSIDISDVDRRHDDISLTARGALRLSLAEQRLDEIEAELFGDVGNDVRGRLRKVAIEAIDRGERWEDEAG